MRFGYGYRREFDGEADVEEWSPDRKRLRVVPEGWKRGIWIGAVEVIEPKAREVGP